MADVADWFAATEAERAEIARRLDGMEQAEIVELVTMLRSEVAYNRWAHRQAWRHIEHLTKVLEAHHG